MTRGRGVIMLLLIVTLVVGGGVQARRAATDPLVRTVVLDQSPSAVVVDRRTGHAFITTLDVGAPATYGFGDLGRVWMLATATGVLLHSAAVGGDPMMAPAVDERDGRIVVVNYEDSVSVLDTHSGALLRTVIVNGSPQAVDIDEAAGRAFVRAAMALSVCVMCAVACSCALSPSETAPRPWQWMRRRAAPLPSLPARPICIRISRGDRDGTGYMHRQRGGHVGQRPQLRPGPRRDRSRCADRTGVRDKL